MVAEKGQQEKKEPKSWSKTDGKQAKEITKGDATEPTNETEEVLKIAKQGED